MSGFESDEIAKLLKTLESREKRERPETFDLEAALAAAHGDPIAKSRRPLRPGDHRLLCGDATKEEDVQTLLAGAKAAMAFTDPPYNVSFGSSLNPRHKHRAIKNDSLDQEDWDAFCRAWAANLLASVEGALYVCMSGKEWPTVSGILAEAGAHWSTTIIWEKDRFVLGRSDYQRSYEPIWYGWREGARHHWCGDRNQGDVWKIERPSDSPYHPTMKPLPLIERAIENSSPAWRHHPGSVPGFREHADRRGTNRSRLLRPGARPTLLFHGDCQMAGVHGAHGARR